MLVLQSSSVDVASEYTRRASTLPRSRRRQSTNEDIELIEIRLQPNEVSVQASTDFLLELNVKRDCKIYDLHLFIDNAMGDRVAIVDLRDPNADGGTREFLSTRRVSFLGTITSINLTPGEYRVGVCSRTARDFQIIRDTAVLQVSGTHNQTFVPYATQHIGTTILPYNYTIKCN
jgi:hypothetical protein